MTNPDTNCDGWEAGPNPVTQIIAVRTAQVCGAALLAFVVLRLLVPPEVFWPWVPWGGGAVAGGLSAYFVATFYARTRFPGAPFWIRVPEMASQAAAVALTFDDGPHPDTTPRLLDILRDSGAKATFFLVGERASAHPHLVGRIVREGHSIGVHGLRHRTMVLQSGRQIAADLAIARRQIEEAAGQPLPALFLRPPYGFKTATLARVAGRSGWILVGWSLDPRDYDNPSANDLVYRVQARLRAGDIILLHERPGATATLDALPQILRICRERGLACVPLAAPANPE